MWKKIIPNTLYTVGIVVCIVYGYQYGIEKAQYGILAGAIVLIAIFVILKIRILKEIKNAQKNP
jgi:Flp pilus assembly protein protease CpaA